MKVRDNLDHPKRINIPVNYMQMHRDKSMFKIHRVTRVLNEFYAAKQRHAIANINPAGNTFLELRFRMQVSSYALR